ncbi:ATPase, T2SS/T4P/T4SS family [Pseudomonas sp. R5(2019)]|uniref:ATPase, T2SS/T4P/T4SS family n=1 Tax=Pseudomonas sp. R5(2019) TaxID=2697566 RepID=UPI001411C2BC|nr:ATPase, T2SS/T4P/T4SS family [Pseudomonas sp. R5(2019)]NBA96416.1 type IV-A pilus assembly ATPase PilB [Pseudomonas sp. R5(2019)]
MNDVALTGLARQLVEAELLTEKSAQQAAQQAHRNRVPLVHFLVQARLLHSREVAEIATEHYGVAFLDLNCLDQESQPKGLVSEKLVRQHHALPLWRRGNKLFVGLSDPTNDQAITDIQFSTGLTTEAILVEEDKLAEAIERMFDSGQTGLEDMADVDLDGVDVEAVDENEHDPHAVQDAKDAPVVRFVNKMLLDAIKGGASDLHFEPYEKTYRVRMRTDGILREVAKPPTQMGIDALGYEPEQKELYLNALRQPQGMILVTGPTGSGKTVSLYTGLNILNTVDINISTAEDPVEINMEGVNQVNVNPKQGLNFAQALRSFLRQDPDVIMVGEIRDLETAEIAIKAAQTGHLVLSTLHTNSAAETLTRLQNMGVAGFNIATSVNLIIAQRLARKLCPHCKRPIDIPREALIKEGFEAERIGTFTVYEPAGCEHCNNGYKGRVGIYEVVKNTPAMQRLIMAEGNALDIARQMREDGFNDLRKSGLLKVMQGVTSLEEVNRVTKD